MTEFIKVPIQVLPNGQGMTLPHYATSRSAGVDLGAAIEAPVVLRSLERTLIPTGFAMALPIGYEAQIRSRSGLAYNHGIAVLNSPGTIDADYRGEIKVLLINLSKDAFKIERGMRIAQMLIQPVYHLRWEEKESLDPTTRGEKGFGSTGISSPTQSS